MGVGACDACFHSPPPPVVLLSTGCLRGAAVEMRTAIAVRQSCFVGRSFRADGGAAAGLCSVDYPIAAYYLIAVQLAAARNRRTATACRVHMPSIWTLGICTWSASCYAVDYWVGVCVRDEEAGERRARGGGRPIIKVYPYTPGHVLIARFRHMLITISHFQNAAYEVSLVAWHCFSVHIFDEYRRLPDDNPPGTIIAHIFELNVLIVFFFRSV